MLPTLVTALVLSGACLAHGDHGAHSQKPIVSDNANWMTKHMAGKSKSRRSGDNPPGRTVVVGPWCPTIESTGSIRLDVSVC